MWPFEWKLFIFLWCWLLIFAEQGASNLTCGRNYKLWPFKWKWLSNEINWCFLFFVNLGHFWDCNGQLLDLSLISFSDLQMQEDKRMKTACLQFSMVRPRSPSIVIRARLTNGALINMTLLVQSLIAQGQEEFYSIVWDTVASEHLLLVTIKWPF